MKWVGKDKQRMIADQAREDAVSLLADGVDAETEAHINHCCEALPGYRDELLETSRFMADLEGLADDPDICNVLSTYQSDSTAAPVEETNRWHWSYVGVAAGVLLAVVASLFLSVDTPAPLVDIDRYITKIGEQKTVTLDDGSVLTMNTGTLLLVEMTGDSRRVILERGEAFFDVAKDASRPFTVLLGERSVSVLGTQFNIHKSPDQFTLAVVDGAVSVHKPQDAVYTKAPLVLPAGQERIQFSSRMQRKVTAGMVVEYDYASEKTVAYLDRDIARYQRWRTGILSFNNEPLGKVVQELNRYTAKKILVESSALLDTEIYATIRIDQIALALEALENSLPIRVIVHFDRIVITDKQN